MFLPATPSSSSWTLKGLFELALRCLSALNLTSYFASIVTKILGHHQINARRGGTSTKAKTIFVNLDCVCVCVKSFFALNLDCEKLTKYDLVVD